MTLDVDLQAETGKVNRMGLTAFGAFSRFIQHIRLDKVATLPTLRTREFEVDLGMLSLPPIGFNGFLGEFHDLRSR